MIPPPSLPQTTPGPAPYPSVTPSPALYVPEPKPMSLQPHSPIQQTIKRNRQSRFDMGPETLSKRQR